MNSAAEPILDVIIGCDCDPDRPGYGGTRYDTRAALTWRGIEEGVPRLREIADAATSDQANPVRITWCIRSDLQMREVHGDCAWPAERFGALWTALARAGDEIAWHPHLWRWDGGAHCWYQEIEDADWIAECLDAGHRALLRQTGRAPLTSRTGWEFHNNATMDAMRRLGIRVDFSAIPGRYTPGGSDRWGSRFNCHVDWRGTPETPYAPSAADYRRPAQEGEPADLLEVPMSVLHSGLLRFARVARRVCAGRRAALRELVGGDASASAAGGNKLYVTMPPVLFARLVVQQLLRARQSGRAMLVTALHPDEMCVTGRGLTATHHPAHVRANLAELLRRADRAGVRVRFTTPAELQGEAEGASSLHAAMQAADECVTGPRALCSC
ncbi:MAG: hypothetical protein ACOX9R_15495, partial [Armatimonadota bacterium]